MIKEYDYFIVDQLSFCIPLLQMFAGEDTKILFYCHFPDQLLAQKGSLLKSIYRYPFDTIEEWTTGLSDKIVVNSKFTKLIFHRTFKNLNKIEPGVIYPCVDLASVEPDVEADIEVTQFMNKSRFFLSVNRFEKKKNVALAIKAFAQFKKEYDQREEKEGSKPRLVVAGGFDLRISENVEVLQELNRLAELLELRPFTIRGKLIVLPPSTDVLFLPSIKSSIKTSLIKKCEILLYTPSFEHFGIVPVEGMLCETPVLATNTGGPLESIVNYDFTPKTLNKATGYICEPDSNKWSAILIRHFFELSQLTKETLGANGLQRVKEVFLRTEMSKAFLDNLQMAAKSDKGIVFNVLRHVNIDSFSLVLAIAMSIKGQKFAYYFLAYRLVLFIISRFFNQ